MQKEKTKKEFYFDEKKKKELLQELNRVAMGVKTKSVKYKIICPECKKIKLERKYKTKQIRWFLNDEKKKTKYWRCNDCDVQMILKKVNQEADE